MSLYRWLVFLFSLVALGCSAHRPARRPAVIHQSSVQREVVWQRWGAKALLLAKGERKPVALFFYMNGCSVCKRMENTTFKNKVVVDVLDKDFVPVKDDGTLYPDNMKAIFGQNNVFPDTAFIMSDGKVEAAVTGYVGVQRYTSAMRRVLAQ